MKAPTRPGNASGGPLVFRLQLALLAGFSLFATSVVVWVGRLIYISWQLEDVFSASIGIALIAVPIFLFLLVLVNTLFWELQRGRAAGPPAGERS
jgi:hypothetical protein